MKPKTGSSLRASRQRRRCRLLPAGDRCARYRPYNYFGRRARPDFLPRSHGAIILHCTEGKWSLALLSCSGARRSRACAHGPAGLRPPGRSKCLLRLSASVSWQGVLRPPVTNSRAVVSSRPRPCWPGVPQQQRGYHRHHDAFAAIAGKSDIIDNARPENDMFVLSEGCPVVWPSESQGNAIPGLLGAWSLPVGADWSSKFSESSAG
jgi:hypothetical protein